jgi:hypothetical protein
VVIGMMRTWRERRVDGGRHTHLHAAAPSRCLGLSFAALTDRCGYLESRHLEAEPRQQQDWTLESVQGGRDHPLAACGVAAVFSSHQR